MKKKITMTAIFLLLMILMALAQSSERSTMTDRELVERLTRIEEGQKYILGLTVLIIASIVILIGYIVWDKRTLISPSRVRKPRELKDKDRLLLKYLEKTQNQDLN